MQASKWIKLHVTIKGLTVSLTVFSCLVDEACDFKKREGCEILRERVRLGGKSHGSSCCGIGGSNVLSANLERGGGEGKEERGGVWDEGNETPNNKD